MVFLVYSQETSCKIFHMISWIMLPPSLYCQERHTECNKYVDAIPTSLSKDILISTELSPNHQFRKAKKN